MFVLMYLVVFKRKTRNASIKLGRLVLPLGAKIEQHVVILVLAVQEPPDFTKRISPVLYNVQSGQTCFCT